MNKKPSFASISKAKSSNDIFSYPIIPDVLKTQSNDEYEVPQLKFIKKGNLNSSLEVFNSKNSSSEDIKSIIKDDFKNDSKDKGFNLSKNKNILQLKFVKQSNGDNDESTTSCESSTEDEDVNKSDAFTWVDKSLSPPKKDNKVSFLKQAKKDIFSFFSKDKKKSVILTKASRYKIDNIDEKESMSPTWKTVIFD